MYRWRNGSASIARRPNAVRHWSKQEIQPLKFPLTI